MYKANAPVFWFCRKSGHYEARPPIFKIKTIYKIKIYKDFSNSKGVVMGILVLDIELCLAEQFI